MALKLGGFASSGPCGCCGGCTGNYIRVTPCPLLGTTVRFQGPNGEDTSVTITSPATYAQYNNAANGTWTITVSRLCYTTQTLTQTVSSCASYTLTPELVLAYTTVSYSDDLGTVTINLAKSPPFLPYFPACTVYGGTATYTYTSSKHTEFIYCGAPINDNVPFPNQTSTIPIKISVSFQSQTDGSMKVVYIRDVNIQPTAQDCTLPPHSGTPSSQPSSITTPSTFMATYIGTLGVASPLISNTYTTSCPTVMSGTLGALNYPFGQSGDTSELYIGYTMTFS